MTLKLLHWEGEQLRPITNVLDFEENIIGYLRPVIPNFLTNITFLSASKSLRAPHFTTEFQCSYYSALGSCREATQERNDTQTAGKDNSVWDLGSIHCQSQYSDVCEHFLATSEEKCSAPGCLPNEFYDPETNTCFTVPSLDLNITHRTLQEHRQFKTTAYKEEALRWPADSLCDYLSSCRAAQLGLVPEYRLNCYCDTLCHYYNDCCKDAPPATDKIIPIPSGTFK